MVKHLACIMDGNRRWAKQRNLPVWDGHREGVAAAERVIDFCIDQNIPYLSLYTFSLENFSRPEAEKQFLFSILLHEVKKRAVSHLIAKGVKITFVGDRSRFPENALQTISDIEHETRNGTALHINLLFCYGGRQEIMYGVRKTIELLKRGAIAEDQMTDEEFEKLLWTAGIPAPDIIVRTGGVHRLSNFLLYQAAYSEIYFIDEYWPDLSMATLHQLVERFSRTTQNFGT